MDSTETHKQIPSAWSKKKVTVTDYTNFFSGFLLVFLKDRKSPLEIALL